MEMKFKTFKIMKLITILFFTILIVISCKSVEISPTDVIGKWQPQYYIPYNFKDNTWGKAILVDSLSNNYVLEFADQGEFLINGKLGGSCCYAGDKYEISGNEIAFSDLSINGCQNIYCYNCAKWTIEEVNEQILIIEECDKRKIQYIKTK